MQKNKNNAINSLDGIYENNNDKLLKSSYKGKQRI